MTITDVIAPQGVRTLEEDQALVRAEYEALALALLRDPAALEARIALERERAEWAGRLIAEAEDRLAQGAAFAEKLGKIMPGPNTTFSRCSNEPKEQEPKQEPAVSIRASVKPDFIVCLEDGKRLKMLKRHLMTHYNMTPDEYRAKWNLPVDYPMVAPNYAKQRRKLAKNISLGTKRLGAKRPV